MVVADWSEAGHRSSSVSVRNCMKWTFKGLDRNPLLAIPEKPAALITIW
jgi:hypothetical protein